MRRLTRIRTGIGTAALAALASMLLATLSPSAGAAIGATNPRAVPGAVGDLAGSKITHVVIIYQENHTFDDALGAICQTRETPCNGYVGPVTFADGKTATDIVQPDLVPIIKHDPVSQHQAAANEWDSIQGCTKPPYACVSHVDPSKIPNMRALADTYAVSDATFAAGPVPSFGAHEDLASGTDDGFLGDNPVRSKQGHKPGPGWGCPSFRDALWASPRQYVPSCVPDAAGNGPYRNSPVPYAPTIMQRMEQAGLTWHIYQGTAVNAPVDTVYSVCSYFQWCVENRFNKTYDSATADFVSKAHAGSLPNLSVLVPTGGISQHNGTSMAKGDNYIGQMVKAVEQGPDWNSTAIFITYDDCGCFYDHVKPPGSLGLRNPMVIISPWAKADSTDSTTAVQPYSMLAFTEHNFNLAPLSAEVSKAYDYSGSFDFGQQPLGRAHMTVTPISAAEQARVAMLAPLVAKDPG